MDLYPKLEDLLLQFKKKDRDFIFLINQDVKISQGPDSIESKITDSLEIIWNELLEDTDIGLAIYHRLD